MWLLAVALLLGACSRNPAPVSYPPPPPPPPPPAASYADQLFRAGWQALAADRFAEAVELMQRAIQEDGAESASRQVTLAPDTAVPYLPHHFMGVALAILGDCRAALSAWDTSLRQGAVQQTSEMTRLLSLKRDCEATLAEAPLGMAAPSAPDVRGDPAESEQRYRAEAELAAATAAARRAERSPAVALARRHDDDFAREWLRAESLLAEVNVVFSAALARGDVATFDRVRQESAIARRSFDELRLRADALFAPTASGEIVGEAPATDVLADRSPQAAAPVIPDAPAGAAPPPPTTAPSPGTEAGTTAIPVQWLLLGTGVLLLSSVLLVAVLVPHPTAFQYVAFRTTLSLAATCVAASIPWLMSMSGDVQRAGSIGGALAVFVIVYFLDPIGRRPPEPGVPAGIAGLAPPVVPEACIFLSYRRTDSEDVVGRLHGALVETFGDAAVFKDVDDVTLGVDFRKVLKDAVGSCRVILAVIGPAWEEVRNDAGQRRLDDPADWVRIEISSALQREIPVIPVLIRRQQLPPAEQLPADLRDLVYRQAIQLRPDPDFDNDVARLVANLNRLLDVPASAAP